MANRREAFNSSMQDLKERIKYHSTNRMKRPPTQDPTHGGQHEEPDGDEDEQGREPPGPEEDSDELGEGGVRKFHKLPPALGGDPAERPELEGEIESGKKWKKEAEPMLSCRSCNADVGKDDSFCRKCGDRR